MLYLFDKYPDFHNFLNSLYKMVDPDDDVDVNWFHIVGGKSAFKYKVMPKFSAAVMITKV